MNGSAQTHGSLVLVVALASMAACIDLPTPLADRGHAQANGGAGGSAGTGGGQGGAGGGGGSGGVGGAAAPLPVCSPSGQTAGCASIEAVALGDRHTCALASDGYVRCWGANDLRQLGNPALELLVGWSPRIVEGLSGVDAIVAGHTHTCAQVDDRVYCWGNNDYGQLGLGDTVPRDTPEMLPIGGVVAVSTLRDVTCLLTEQSEVWCAGKLLDGQAWDGTKFDPDFTLVQGLSDFGPIARLGVGQVTACVVSDDGEAIRCWGDNLNGYVGDGTTIDRLLPTPVSDALATPVSVLSVGSGWTCSISTGPELQCWGNFSEVHGTIFSEPTSLPLVATSGLVDVDTGWSHLCLRYGGGDVYCFGKSGYGQLGPNVGLGQLTATPAFVIGNTAHLEVGWQHSCVILQDGEVRCWGRNHGQQIAPGDTSDFIQEPTPVPWDG